MTVALVAAALATSAFGGASGATQPQPSGPRMPAALPVAYPPTASVDPLVDRQLERDGSADVLVTLDGASTLSSARAEAHGGSRGLLRRTEPGYRALKAGLHLRVPGLRVLEDYRSMPVQLVRVRSRRELARLRADPSVVGIGADRVDSLDLSQSLPLIDQPEAAAAGHTGSGTAVAVLDSGVDYRRSAFGSCPAPGTPGCKVVVAQDFAPDDGMRDDPAAGFHGTNVAGIVVGVAPDTKVLGLDVFNGPDSRISTQVAAINFVISRQANYNIRAINMSLGASESFNTSSCGDPSDARVAAFANARAAGIVPVIASGNDRFANGSNHVGVSRPACIPGAFPVGAVYDSATGGHTWGGPNANDTCTDATSAADRIPCFSQVWTGPMMLAPGALITAAGVTQGGTSQAAPHVAGAVAV
ncbi:MAG TPA: S8 family serine peptidase, partial [Actinomycetota bacterium]|nr:S8 family serine peptidase [Actinomycetota bacterium]